MKNKLLSPTQLREFRSQQAEQKRIRAEELERKNRRLSPPKELLDPKVEPVVEEPEVVEEPKEPIEILRERIDQLASQIKQPKYYDEQIAQLEVILASKIGFDEFNLAPIEEKIQSLKESVPELHEIKYYDSEIQEVQKQLNELDIRYYETDIESLTERVDELQVSGSEIFKQHGENLREIKKAIHQVIEDLVKVDAKEIPDAFDPTDIQNDIAATKETFYERVAELKKDISELPEVKYYDRELRELKERIQIVKDSIPEVPEVKYYDDDLENLITLIAEVRGSIPELPEVRYYEEEIESLEEAIKSVEDRIPTVPEVRYYDDDIKALREDIENVLGQMPEIPEVKSYDEEVENLFDDIDKVRDGIVDIKLAIKAVEKSVEVVEGREIPEAFDPTGLEIEIEKAFKEIEKLKEQPVSVKEDSDPLTPLEDKFVKFEDLAEHYRIFINRIQQQLSSLGGGGEVNLRYLDDVDVSNIGNGKVLSYNSTTKKFEFISPGAASSLWSENGDNIYRDSNVGINNANPQAALDVVGDINVTGVITATSFVGDVSGDISGTLTGEFVGTLDKTLEYYASGSLSTVTTSQGTKTLYYDNAGILTGIIGTGSYVSKEFTYDGDGNLININVL